MSLLCDRSRYIILRTARSVYSRPAFRAASRIAIPTPPPFPVIESCPIPTCTCRETPPNLDIDRDSPLNGTTASYAEQVLISTGRSDWPSKIEDAEDAGFVRQLRKFLGRGGKYSDPFHNVMITTSSIPPTPPDTLTTISDRKSPGSLPASQSGTDPDIVPQTAPQTAPASAFLLPSFTYVPSIPPTDSSVTAFLKAFVLPSRLHAQHSSLSRADQNILLRQPSQAKQFLGARPAHEILILICGHGTRDTRCGVLGPVLAAEFEDKLQRENVVMLTEPPVMQAVDVDMEKDGYVPNARVALISHVGGHKFAGNVIVYIPPGFRGNALAGKGIWYGRVEPGHVEGIVRKTVMEGKVIKELFRGGIGQGGETLRL